MDINKECLTKIIQHITRLIQTTSDIKEIKNLTQSAVSISQQLSLLECNYNECSDEDYAGYEFIEDEGIAVRWVHDDGKNNE